MLLIKNLKNYEYIEKYNILKYIVKAMSKYHQSWIYSIHNTQRRTNVKQN